MAKLVLRCANGHPMILVEKDPYEPAAGRRCMCDHCGAWFSGNMFHCHSCRFDLCWKCVWKVDLDPNPVGHFSARMAPQPMYVTHVERTPDVLSSTVSSPPAAGSGIGFGNATVTPFGVLQAGSAISAIPSHGDDINRVGNSSNSDAKAAIQNVQAAMQNVAPPPEDEKFGQSDQKPNVVTEAVNNNQQSGASDAVSPSVLASNASSNNNSDSNSNASLVL